MKSPFDIHFWRDCPTFSLSMDFAVCDFVSYKTHQIQTFLWQKTWLILMKLPWRSTGNFPCLKLLDWESRKIFVQTTMRKFGFCSRCLRILNPTCIKFFCTQGFAQTSSEDLKNFQIDLIAFSKWFNFQGAFWSCFQWVTFQMAFSWRYFKRKATRCVFPWHGEETCFRVFKWFLWTFQRYTCSVRHESRDSRMKCTRFHVMWFLTRGCSPWHCSDYHHSLEWKYRLVMKEILDRWPSQ